MTWITTRVTPEAVHPVGAGTLLLALAAMLALPGCGAGGEAEGDIGAALARLPATPAALRGGQAAYDRHCASCHGASAAGTAKGPPLAHRYYVPSHHADAAFRLAVRNGVAAHHWRFGDMPPQPQVRDDEVEPIIAYVRWVQREVGIR